jgi:Plavaka transposase
VGGKKLTRELLAHCHRELIHEQWKCLLDDEFLFAYEHGIVIVCSDGLQRRFYPRIFTYSADYPEKYVFALKFVNTDRCFSQSADD